VLVLAGPVGLVEQELGGGHFRQHQPIGRLTRTQLRRHDVTMERVCSLGRMRPERLAEYRARHERVWLDQGVQAGRRDTSRGLKVEMNTKCVT